MLWKSRDLFRDWNASKELDVFWNIPRTSKLFPKEKPLLITKWFFFWEVWIKIFQNFELLPFFPLKLSKYHGIFHSIFSQNKIWCIDWYYSFKYIILYFISMQLKNIYFKFPLNLKIFIIILNFFINNIINILRLHTLKLFCI